MLKKILENIKIALDKKDSVIIAIDGRCASGKTTIAEKIRKETGCNVIHMDDFFLRPEQRSEERLSLAGENIDHERFLIEVLLPLSEGRDFFYRPFDCGTLRLKEPIEVKHNPVTVIEGSYSCHKALWDYYDIRIFMDVEKDEQLKRIEKRNGKDGVKAFREKWIPLEEKYFEAYNIKEKCEIVIK